MKFILNESLSEKDIRKAMSKVYQAYEKYNENDSNQNCMLCAWALEMQLRGNRSFLPRPVFSPRDVVFTEIDGGWLIIKKPRKIRIKKKLSVIQEVEEAEEGSRFYCHVNWQDSTGGHEFLVLNIDGKAYVADAQANVLNLVEDDHTYFEDINWDNSLLVRLDNKEIDNNILKYNDDKYIIEWDDELDIAFLKAQEGEITEAISTGTEKLNLVSIQNFIESCDLAKTTPPKEGGCYITPSGLYINTSDIKLKNKKLAREFDGEHEGLVYYLLEKGVISQYTDLLSAEAVPYVLNYIRCRNDGEAFTYLRLPPEALTQKQLRALESWLETCPYEYDLEVENASGIQFQSYDWQEYSIEDIMRKVRRYYIYKKLEEAVTESLEKITYKPVKDVEQFKTYADQILGGDGNMSAADIQSSIKEIYIDNELVGYIGFSEYEEDDVKMLGIGNFMTIQQGKGHGTKIINDIVETKKNEYDLIYCFVDADNTGAIRLYKKLGTVYDEDGPNDNGQYYVTFYDNGKFDLDEDYDPPYNEEQIKANYGDETYQRLIDDPAHAWRMKTGLELIHKEPSKKELERIWANWQEMTDEQKAESDKKSIELFGKTNAENYNELIKLYESVVEKEVEKFESGESQLLFIVGLSASGKTTLANKLGDKYSAEVVNLDKFDIKYNTDNYIKSKNIPNIIEQFTNEVGIIEQGDINIEKFMSWIIEQELEQPVIVEGVQLLSFPETIKDFPIIVLDLPIETLIKQQLDRNDGDWETIIINDTQFDNYEDWEAALSDSYKEEQEKLNDFIAKVNNQKFTLNESDTKEPKLYCISQEDLDGQILEPRVPDNFFTKNGYEDGETPRVCFAPTIEQCLMGLSQNLKEKEFYVFSPEKVPEKNIYKPTVEEVPDSEITDETWITCPVKLKKVGKIKVLGDSGLDGHPFNYGDKTAELYDWDWEWLD